MITPRLTRLVRVPDLRAFRHTISGLAVAGDPERRQSRLVLVPTSAAARQLRKTMADPPPPSEIVTREELYDRLQARLNIPADRLTPYDRDVIMQSAAREASSGEARRLRPGLIAEILRFYDQLRRQGRNVGRFEELLAEVLSRDAEHDQGAERMLAQARWLASTFQGYERRVRESGACDEHVLRERLIAHPPTGAVLEIIVTVADWIADPNGLFLADFDMLTRLPGVEAIDIVATVALLESGFHQRVHEWLPGIQEAEAADLRLTQPLAGRPVLAVPAADPDRLVFVQRDREEELIAIASRLKADGAHSGSLDRVAVVFKRPLPYLYLARDVFGRAGLPYQAFDALPLAAEPFAAAIDLVLDFVGSGFTRRSMVALLRSPHFVFQHVGQPVGRQAIAALDRALSDMRYLGTLERLMEIEVAQTGDGEAAWVALGSARAAATALAPLLDVAPASAHLRSLIAFLDAHEAEISECDQDAARLRRGRKAVREVLAALAAAYEAHDDAPVDITGIAASVRRWIEEHTFLPDANDTGVQLVDDQAARYGEFDEMALVGLIEGEWPERPKRNIFYPTSLLASLGWPTEKDRRSAGEARFLELLGSSSRRVMVSTVSLDDEALVEPSIFVEEIGRARLPVVPLEKVPDPCSEVEQDAQAWLSMRSARTAPDAAEFHGFVGPAGATASRKPWSVSALETYLACPFKFFAQHVLRLDEEPEDEEVMDPRTQGQFVHEVFEAFFRQWQEEGHQAITADTIDAARARFLDAIEQLVEKWNLSDTEAAMERTRLLGSPAAAGLGEAVFRMEAERPVPVVDRRLEYKLKGEFTFETSDGPRRLAISGKTDRIDLLADGTFRLIDYKLGWPPNKGRALQLPIYGVCAEQHFDALGRRSTMSEAAYIAFKGPKRVVSLFTSTDERAKVLADAQQRLVDTVDGIDAGRFPPTPDDVFRCETCTYAAVCRKDYVGDV